LRKGLKRFAKGALSLSPLFSPRLSLALLSLSLFSFVSRRKRIICVITCLHVWRCEQYGMMLAQIHKPPYDTVASAVVRVRAAIGSVFNFLQFLFEFQMKFIFCFLLFLLMHVKETEESRSTRVRV